MTRCAAASLARDEPLWATASTQGIFLLLEDPGPWGPHVLHSRRLPDAVRAVLGRARQEWGVRPLLIRRPERTGPGPRRVIAVNARLGWAQSTVVDDLADIASWDLSSLTDAAGPGLPAHPDPVVLVCTHGRHDPCCAERGRPLAAAVAARFPGLVWEASHLGGDRFAGNLVVLPRGDYFGRLDPLTGPDAVALYLAGSLDLAHHRGRSTQSWPVQAAESAARRSFDAPAFDDVAVVRVARERSGHRVDLVVRGEAVRALVRVTDAGPAMLTCHAVFPEPPHAWEVSLTGPVRG